MPLGVFVVLFSLSIYVLIAQCVFVVSEVYISNASDSMCMFLPADPAGRHDTQQLSCL